MEMNNKVKVIAHTGTMNTPMNSLESIREGLKWDVDYIEVDVRFMPDGTPIMTHDPPGNFAFPLEQGLEIIAGQERAGVALDLKERTSLDRVVELLKKYCLRERSIYVGTFIDELPLVLERGGGIDCFPDLERHMIPDSAFALNTLAENIRQKGARGLCIHYTDVTKPLVDHFHRAGILISAWTVDDCQTMKKMLDCGIDYLNTNRPDRARQCLSAC
jgi:glycerophosphoryl diester phosphodiesterase